MARPCVRCGGGAGEGPACLCHNTNACDQRLARCTIGRIEATARYLAPEYRLRLVTLSGWGGALDLPLWTLAASLDGKPVRGSECYRYAHPLGVVTLLPLLLERIDERTNTILRGGGVCTPGDARWQEIHRAFHDLLDLVGEAGELAGGIYGRAA